MFYDDIAKGISECSGEMSCLHPTSSDFQQLWHDMLRFLPWSHHSISGLGMFASKTETEWQSEGLMQEIIICFKIGDPPLQND